MVVHHQNDVILGHAGDCEKFNKELTDSLLIGGEDNRRDQGDIVGSASKTGDKSVVPASFGLISEGDRAVRPRLFLYV